MKKYIIEKIVAHPKIAIAIILILFLFGIFGTCSVSENMSKKEEVERLGKELTKAKTERDGYLEDYKIESSKLKDTVEKIKQTNNEIKVETYYQQVIIDRNIYDAIDVLERSEYLVE